MTRYLNIFTRKYRLYQEDFIRWKSYGSLEEAQEGAIEERTSSQRFKKTIIIDLDQHYDGVDFSDEFFEEIFPETHHHYDGDVVYINPA